MSPDQQITFNTGRLYTARGQVITAVHLPDEEKVRFADHSRMIYGEFDMPTYSVDFEGWPGLFANRVMGHYDRHEYRMSLEAMQLCESDQILNYTL